MTEIFAPPVRLYRDCTDMQLVRLARTFEARLARGVAARSYPAVTWSLAAVYAELDSRWNA